MNTPMAVATRKRRIGATLIDALLTAAVVSFLTLASGQFEVAAPYLDGSLMIRAGALVAAGYLLLHGLLLYRSAQTVGKKLTGLYIVSGDGETQQRAPFWRLLLRAGALLLLIYIPVVGYWSQLLHLMDVLLFLLPAGLSLHDRISGTRVRTNG